jgi:hypothetical protein
VVAAIRHLAETAKTCRLAYSRNTVQAQRQAVAVLQVLRQLIIAIMGLDIRVPLAQVVLAEVVLKWKTNTVNVI